jgi:hypothetical protein
MASRLQVVDHLIRKTTSNCLVASACTTSFEGNLTREMTDGKDIIPADRVPEGEMIGWL